MQYPPEPQAHCIKINSDVAVKEETSFIGVVARDHSGKVLELKAAQLHTDIPELAEGYDVLQGLVLAKEKGWKKIWLESDSRNVIFQLENHDSTSAHWLSEGVFADIQSLRNDFQEVQFTWVSREENFLAHFVSQWCLKNNFVGSIPIDSLAGMFPIFVA
ncbi:uncharacterized protein LOC125421543 [Ziziphus jujuba]|uniref:Uncharacterized protein LOC125421543 n=1 Tax=Ziziphus jujuba TaxID=326968 RepID=A0ABM3IEH6_ZIZJJ|nr:uncharacterized protein LOC125421543 [Ziziphus jujuba]